MVRITDYMRYTVATYLRGFGQALVSARIVNCFRTTRMTQIWGSLFTQKWRKEVRKSYENTAATVPVTLHPPLLLKKKDSGHGRLNEFTCFICLKTYDNFRNHHAALHDYLPVAHNAEEI